MSTVLDEFSSASNPGKKYQIIQGDDSVVYCNCPAWKFKKMCKHLNEYMRKANLKQFYDKYYPTETVVNKPDDFNDIVTKAVQMIKGA